MRYKLDNIDVFEVAHSICVAITDCMTSEELKNYWKEIRNEIMMKYQNSLTDDFSRWNFYIFYVVDNLDSLDGSLRYIVEHDTVSSRKILIDTKEIKDDGSIYDIVINKYINYNIIPVNIQSEGIESFERSEDVVELINTFKK